MISIMNFQEIFKKFHFGYIGDPPPSLQPTPPPPPLQISITTIKMFKQQQQQLNNNSECNNNNYDNSNSVRLLSTTKRIKRNCTGCDNRTVVIINNKNNNIDNNINDNNDNNSFKQFLTNIKKICDCHHFNNNRTVKDCVYINNNINNNNNNKSRLSIIITNIYLFILLLYTCLFQQKFTSLSIVKINNNNNKNSFLLIIILLLLLLTTTKTIDCYPNEFDKTEQLLDKLNLEQSIAAVFNKVAYGGSTTKRSIPDNIYPITTLATPLLTTYRYSDGNDEWLRVDIKNNGNNNNRQLNRNGNVNFDIKDEYDDDNNNDSDNDDENDNNSRDNNNSNNYGVDLEKDHVLPTSAPAADILKNNNNKHYNNPNRYNNDRLRPDYDNQQQQQQHEQQEHITENIYKTTTSYNLLRNIRPTKSMYSKDIPSYIPPSRAFFTPPLPPEYQNPFADTPTLRGKNSESFASRRPIPPPSLMPNKDRIPFRPDLPPNKVNIEKQQPERPHIGNNNSNNNNNNKNDEKKKTLNTPSQNVRLNEFYGMNRSNLLNNNNSGGDNGGNSFEYEKSYAPEPSITRILSGSNGRHDDVKIPDILYHTVTATPNFKQQKITTTRITTTTTTTIKPPPIEPKQLPTIPKDESTTIRRKDLTPIQQSPSIIGELTTELSVNLPNVRQKETNLTTSTTTTNHLTTEKIWLICWNVHIYLIVFLYIILAIYSIYKLICYENDPHMFSKSYFLTIHLMLTVICVLRIFYLIYDAYNINRSFNIFLYEFLHNFPLSLLATTFSVLILFLLKRTLIHLEVKNPIILVVCAIIYILLCFILSIFENFNYFDKASLIICRPIYVLLVWSLGCSYLYLYRIIKNVLSKKSQNLSEICTQNILYASHITIAIALLFILLGIVQLYSLFFIKIDHFHNNNNNNKDNGNNDNNINNNELIQQHWILWGYELSIRFIEITIIILLSMVVSLKLSQRNKILNNEKHNSNPSGGGGFQLFPCTTNTTTTTTTSDSSTDNIYPNNCNTNPNVINYSRNEMLLDNLNDNKKNVTTTLERQQQQQQQNFERFERPNWQISDNLRNDILRNSTTKRYHHANNANKSKYDLEYDDYHNSDNSTVQQQQQERNIYSEPIDNNPQQQQQFERSDFDRRSRNSSTNTTTSSSGRRSTTGRNPKNHQQHHHHHHQHYHQQSSSSTASTTSSSTTQQQQRPSIHLSGIQTLPNHQFLEQQQLPHRTIESMLVDEQGFVRFRHIQDDLIDNNKQHKKQHLKKMMQADINHYSDA